MTTDGYQFEHDARAWCSTCRNMNKHAVLCDERRRSEPLAYGWEKAYEIIACNGCESVSFRTREVQQHRWGAGRDGMMALDEITHQYPPRSSRATPLWVPHLPEFLDYLTKEVYAALDNGLLNLAAMGARSVVERVMREEIGDQGTFQKGLAAIVAQGLITEADSHLLDAALDLGHAATHRGFRVAEQQLATAMRIIEQLLERLYILPDEEGRLKSIIPPRVRPAKGQHATP